MGRGLALLLGLAVVGLCVVVAAMAESWAPLRAADFRSGLEPVRPGQETSLKRATFSAGQLWVLTDAGELWRVKEGKGGAEHQGLAEPAYDLCLSGNDFHILTGAREQPNELTLRVWRDERWIPLGSVATPEGTVALVCDGPSVLVLTENRLTRMAGERTGDAVALGKSIPVGALSAALLQGDKLFLGFNAGEWGGGLQRIDTRSGRVDVLHKNATGELCDGPLNTNCDPVNGLATHPWKQGCIVAAIGLSHMSAHGRLVEICGDSISRLYFRACEDQALWPNTPTKAGEEPFCTEPFYGLQRTADRLVSVSPSGITKLGSDQQVERLPMPRMEEFGPFGVAFMKDAVLVANTANQRHSVSGTTPLMAQR